MTENGSGMVTEDVPALRKGLTVLDSLAHDGLATLTELQQRSRLNRTMSFRIAHTLRERGYVRHDPVSHRFVLSFKLLEPGRAATEQLDNEIGARCIGVPILSASGYPFAVMSISGPVGRVGDELLSTMVERLWQASREVSRRLGHGAPIAASETTTRASGGGGQ